MNWMKIWQWFLVLSALAYLFVPPVYEFFPMGFLLVAFGIIVTAPIVGMRALKRIQHRSGGCAER